MKLACRRCRADQHVAPGEAFGPFHGQPQAEQPGTPPGPGLPRSGDGLVFCHRQTLLNAAQS